MRASVVIGTVQRRESLLDALEALRYQRHRDFEVVLVEGPGAGGHPALPPTTAAALRRVSCPELNVSAARNAGIAAASGEVVAFLDDDAVPEPGWLEELLEAYADPRVVGAGGLVFDRSGSRRQYRYSTCDRLGGLRYDHRAPLDEWLVPGADPFLYLQGTNMSFRRDALVAAGGFDEEFGYLYDEVDMCLALIDRGGQLRALAGAAVHHRHLASPIRDDDGLQVDPYHSIRSLAYFALRHGRPGHSTGEILDLIGRRRTELGAYADSAWAEGRFDTAQHQRFLERLEAGEVRGVQAGLSSARGGVELPPADPSAFRPYPVRHQGVAPLRICFLRPDSGPTGASGVARAVAEMAAALAAHGQEVHVLTRGAGSAEVGFARGIWEHRVGVRDRRLPALEGVAVAGDLYAAAAKYQEVRRLHARAPVDLVVAPQWLAEGLVCALDPELATVTRLVTSMATVIDLHPSLSKDPRTHALMDLERSVASHSRGLIAASEAVVRDVRNRYDIDGLPVWRVPLVVADRRRPAGPPAPPPAPDSTLEIVFAGRLERRKGVDVLLEAAARLVREFAHLRFTLVGPDTPNAELGGQTYSQWFEEASGPASDIRRQVIFAGEVADSRLWELYARAGIVCAPSRYESFGHVLVEASMWGRPIVACAAGGVPELIEDGVTGLLARPGDPDSLTARLRELILDPARRRALGDAARRRYLERYSPAAVAPVALAAYREIASRAAPTDHGAGPSAAALVRRRLAGVLAEVVELDPDRARQTAAELLEGSSYPFDHLAAVRELRDAGDDEFIAGLYRTLFGRSPDPTGRRGCAEQLAGGGARLDLVLALARSEEARARGVPTDWLRGLMDEAHRDLPERLRLAGQLAAPEFVGAVHLAILGRPAQPGDRDRWCAYLESGGSRVNVLLSLARSAEARARGVGPEALAEVTAAERRRIPQRLHEAWTLPDPDFVAALFDVVLGRPADAQARQWYGSALAQGYSRAEIVRQVTASEEARLRDTGTSWLDELPGAGAGRPSASLSRRA